MNLPMPSGVSHRGLVPEGGRWVALMGVLSFVSVSVGLGSRPSITVENGVRLAPVANPRVVILKSKRLLHLIDGDRLLRTYPINLGFAPEGQKTRQADGRTPLGLFRIVSKNPDSPFHRFLGISYPDESAVKRGRQSGLISAGEAASIVAALQAGRVPDWSTALGGGVGIHGHRKKIDWTAGCIAVSNEHIEELYDVLRIGDEVEILP